MFEKKGNTILSILCLFKNRNYGQDLIIKII